MEWLTCIRKAIDYMEENLTERIDISDVAEQVFMSPFFFAKRLFAGYGIRAWRIPSKPKAVSGGA